MRISWLPIFLALASCSRVTSAPTDQLNKPHARYITVNPLQNEGQTLKSLEGEGRSILLWRDERKTLQAQHERDNLTREKGWNSVDRKLMRIESPDVNPPPSPLVSKNAFNKFIQCLVRAKRNATASVAGDSDDVDAQTKAMETGMKGLGVMEKALESGKMGVQAGAEMVQSGKAGAEGVAKGAEMVSGAAETLAAGTGQAQSMIPSF